MYIYKYTGSEECVLIIWLYISVSGFKLAEVLQFINSWMWTANKEVGPHLKIIQTISWQLSELEQQEPCSYSSSCRRRICFINESILSYSSGHPLTPHFTLQLGFDACRKAMCLMSAFNMSVVKTKQILHMKMFAMQVSWECFKIIWIYRGSSYMAWENRMVSRGVVGKPSWNIFLPQSRYGMHYGIQSHAFVYLQGNLKAFWRMFRVVWRESLHWTNLHFKSIYTFSEVRWNDNWINFYFRLLCLFLYTFTNNWIFGMESMLVSPILKNIIIFVTRRTLIYTTALQYGRDKEIGHRIFSCDWRYKSQ